MRRTHSKRRLYPSIDELLRNPFARFRIAAMLGLLLLAVGTCGYVLVEKFSPLDALYMTVITLATVGFDEVRPLDPAGKVFTIVLILGGLGTAAWAFTTAAEAFISPQGLRIIGRKRMDRKVGSLNNHTIICGYGRIGQQIAQMYDVERLPYVVIERDEARLAMLRQADTLHVEGDAADDDVLLRARVGFARALIAVTPTDAVNTFIVLSARGLRSDLFIIARADSLQNEGKLYRAGASKVISPHNLGGRWMGITAINPAITGFIEAMTQMDHSSFSMHEFTVEETSLFAGKTFGEAEIRTKTGALVAAVRQGVNAHAFVPNPADALRLVPGDVLIAIGALHQLNALARLVRPDDPEKILTHGLTEAEV